MYAVIGALAAVENVFPLVPADTAVAIGAFLSGGGRISAVSVFAVTWFGNVAGAIVVYALARHVGRRFFKGALGRRLLRPKSLARIEHTYRRFGTWGIFLSRFIPGVRAVVPPFAGVAGLGVFRSVGPIVVASGLWYGVLTYLATTLIREVDQITRLVSGINRSGLVLLGLAAVATVVVLLVRRSRRVGAPTE